MLSTKEIRQTIINNNTLLYPMNIDRSYDLISLNPPSFSKNEYIRKCKEEVSGKIIRKDINEVEKYKKVKETRYNEWVDNYVELKKIYEDEQNEKKNAYLHPKRHP